MRRLISLAALAAAPTLGAQQLADRLAAVRTGEATFSYAARPDVCGVGDVLMLRWLEPGSQAFIFSPEWGMASGSWDQRGRACTHGPVRVRVGLRAGQVTSLQPSVGASGGGRGRDLGVIATRDAVDFLLAERDAAGIGVDTLSLDHGPSTTFAVHFTWLSANRWGLENLANLESIPPSGATLFVGAPRVAGGSGGPSRVMAVW